MRDNGRKMQIVHSGHNIVTLAAGVASSVLSTKHHNYIRVFTVDEGLKLFVGLPSEAAESKAYTLELGANWDICAPDEVVVIYDGTAEMMY